MKSIILFIIIIFAPTAIFAQLQVKITGIKKNKSDILIAVYNSKSSFLTLPKAVKTAQTSVSEKNASYTFKTLPKGNYAIALFHDLNGNGELDTNFFGVPNEPYGFSNDARGALGPPNYEDCKLTYLGSSQVITIKVK